jgi:mRNA-degrading endonuclease toxin of MazEF toxin-antitoxin module
MTYIKDFEKWNTLKKNINKEERKINVRKGEIRWVAFGVNIGMEIDGKGDSFLRPALILDCVGSGIALVIPITSGLKINPGYLEFEWKEHTDSLCIHHIKSISTKRILKRAGKVSEGKLGEIKSFVKKFYSL